MKNQDLEKRIKNSAENVDIPDALKPEQIEECLRKKKKTVPFYRKTALTAGLAAAVVLLMVFGSWRLGLFSGGHSGETMKQEAAMDSSAKAASADTGETASEGAAGGVEEAADQAAEETGTKPIGDYYHPASLEELQRQEARVRKNMEDGIGNEEVVADGAMAGGDAAKEESAADTGDSGRGQASGTQDYSTTNLLVEGVDEGDVVKTDGTYIYILGSDSKVKILDAKGLKVLAEIPDLLDGETVTYEEMYVDGTKLILAGNSYQTVLAEHSSDTYSLTDQSQAVLVTYDLSDVSRPRIAGSLRQEGTYRTSRKVGDYMYLFSDAYCNPADKKDDKWFLPQINNKKMEAEDIYVSDNIEQFQYLVMSSVNLKRPDKTVDQKSIQDSGDRFHITSDSIYVIRYRWETAETMTDFIRFRCKDGKMEGAAAATLKGELTDDYAINESEGYLRLLLTGWRGDTQTNHVYVLDEQMTVRGKISDLAPGEMIYSARFMGDTGYFVTYRNMDPLFTVDLSDPENPRILGELKVTGFSDYLHFYGKNKLLGIGWETDPETGEQLGLKLSMYDISDPARVKEENKLVLKGIDECEALYAHKKVMVDSGKNLIGFTVGSYGPAYENESGFEGRYLVFSYDPKEGFVSRMKYTLGRDEEYYTYYGNTRGIYIQDTFYVAENSSITAFDMKKDFEKKESCHFS